VRQSIPIYTTQERHRPAGNNVETRGVVTAVDSSDLIQVPEDEHDPVLRYTFSGIYVYGWSTAPQVCDLVTVQALFRTTTVFSKYPR
jgi:hypothetical protein